MAGKRFRGEWPVWVLLLVTAFPFFRALFLGERIGPWDQIAQMAPWNQAPAGKTWDVLQADAVLQFYGWRDLVFHAWQTGHVPFWNHFELAGTPLLANSQSGALYPPHIFVGLLHLPTALGMALLAWLHLFWAALGVYVLSRHLGGGKYGSFAAGFSFGLSAFMLGWAALASVPETVSWIPWCLLGTYWVLDGHPRAILILSSAVAMMFLAGHLQFSAYGIIAILSILAVQAFRNRGKGGTTRIALMATASLVLGFLLAAPQLLPVLANGQHSHRRNNPTWEGFQGYSGGALKPYALLSLPAPEWLGLPIATIDAENESPTPQRFWPSQVDRGANFAESAIGLGPAAFVLLGFTLLSGEWRKRKELIGLGILGLLLAFGTLVGGILFFLVPGWSATGSPGRAEVIFVLAACLMIGSSADAAVVSPLFEGRLFTNGVLRRHGAIMLSLIALLGLGMAIYPGASTFSSRYPLIAITIGMSIAWLGFLRLPFGNRESIRALKWVSGLIFCAAFILPLQAKNSGPPLPKVEVPPGRIAALNGPWDLLSAVPALLPPNLATQMGIHELGGYDSIIDARTRDRLAEIDGQDPAPQANGNMMFVKASADLQKLGEAGVSEVWSSKPWPAADAVAPSADGVYRYKISGPGRISTPNGPAERITESPDGLTFEATGPGPLTIRDSLYEGWTAVVDGQIVTLERHGWPTIALLPGKHRVVLNYVPVGYQTGLIGCGLAFLALASATFATRRRKIESHSSDVTNDPPA